MANIDHKVGGYVIQPATPKNPTTTFTFWWGSGTKAPNEYFDVFVSPELPGGQSTMQALVEVQRAIHFDPGVSPPQPVLNLTLANPNNFPVPFIANHVRIYG